MRHDPVLGLTHRPADVSAAESSPCGGQELCVPVTGAGSDTQVPGDRVGLRSHLGHVPSVPEPCRGQALTAPA